jgi:hypothetical protein
MASGYGKCPAMVPKAPKVQKVPPRRGAHSCVAMTNEETAHTTAGPVIINTLTSSAFEIVFPAIPPRWSIFCESDPPGVPRLSLREGAARRGCRLSLPRRRYLRLARPSVVVDVCVPQCARLTPSHIPSRHAWPVCPPTCAPQRIVRRAS